MSLVPNLRHQEQRRRLDTQQKGLTIVGKNESFQAHLTSFPFCDTDQHLRVETEFDEHLAGNFHLPLPTVNQDDIRQRCFPVGNARKAS